MNKVLNSTNIRNKRLLPDKVTFRDPVLPFSGINFFVIVMFSAAQVIFCYSIVVPSPSSLFYPGTPLKVEIFFSFPPLPVGLRIHGEVSHNETWEHRQPAVSRGQVGMGRMTKEPLRIRSVLQQHVLTAGFKDYCFRSSASAFLKDILSLDSLCVSCT